MEENQQETEEANRARNHEARRARLLEKANKRLEVITGREHNEEIVVPSSESQFYPDPEIERDVYEAPIATPFDPESTDMLEFIKNMKANNRNFEGTQPAPPPVPETLASKFIRSKAPIVILAPIVYLLFALDLDFLVGGAVFSSLLVWEIFEFLMTSFVFVQPKTQGGIVQILFIFGGISQEKSQLILKVLGHLNKCLGDTAIFIFSFVLIHLAWCFLILGESLPQILDKEFSNLLRRDEL